MSDSVLIIGRGSPAVLMHDEYQKMGVITLIGIAEGDHWQHAVTGSRVVEIGSYDRLDELIENVARIARDNRAAVDPVSIPLAENPALALVLEREGLQFIGPSSYSLIVAGDKALLREIARAKLEKIAESAGVVSPIIPWKPVSSLEGALQAAEAIGFPVMVKLARSGGGKGTRLAEDKTQLANEYNGLQLLLSMDRTFGNSVFVEKALNISHIEEQLAIDPLGNVLDLGNRDCSLQRNNQKLRELAPALISAKTAGLIRDYAHALQRVVIQEAGRLAAHDGRPLIAPYRGTMTVEFGVDDDGNVYLLEVNARWQVEGVVSMLSTGQQLPWNRWNFTMGRPLKLGCQQHIYIPPRNAAVEFRINAETLIRQPGGKISFMASPGLVEAVDFPDAEGIHVFSTIKAGVMVSDRYDSGIAAVVATAPITDSPEHAMAAAKRRGLDYLRKVIIRGVGTNISYHISVLEHELGSSVRI